MENITLYEAMEIIDQYLTEHAPKGAAKKYADIIGSKYDKLLDKEEELVQKKKQLRKIADYNPKAIDLFNKTKDDLEKVKAQSSAVHRNFSDKTGINLDNFYGGLSRSKNSPHSKDEIAVRRAKEALGQGQDPRSKLEKKPAGLYVTKESVSSTKLHIYESYDAGIITEEEKNDFLDILNLFED